MNVSVLTSAYLTGLLAPVLDIKVNSVNAQYIAKERGIKVKEIKSPVTEDYTSLIAVKVVTDTVSLEVKGTLFSRHVPRIVSIKGLEVDIIPQGALILLENSDKPGVIGQVGTVLGSSSINIASMQVGRQKVSGDAVTVVSVDTKPDPAVLEKLGKINGVNKVNLVIL
jgi:D-3-phosphoglycerate dehydrogenase